MPPPPPKPPAESIPREVYEAKAVARDGPYGPPACFVPADAWSIDETRRGLDAHVDGKDSLPDVRLQSFGTRPDPSDSRGGSGGK